jgi:hypothetical protein
VNTRTLGERNNRKSKKTKREVISMLDKSIPYKHILMKRPKGAPIQNYELPSGFSFNSYINGKELEWSKIETSVKEFEDEERMSMRKQLGF